MSNHVPSGLRFEVEWLPTTEVTAPELAATWASLAIYVGDECITQVEDVRTGSARKRVFVSLYPLTEWIVYNWWFLSSHSRPTLVPTAEWSFARRRYPWEPVRPRWVPSHSLRGAGDGFHWPDLALVPDGDLMQVVWFSDARPAESDRIRYLSAGETWLQKAGVLEALGHLVETIRTRLEQEGIKGTPMQVEWRELAALDDEEKAYFESAARLGIDAASPVADESALAAMVQVAGRIDAALLGDLFDAAGTWELTESTEWVKAASDQYHRRAGRQPQAAPLLAAAPLAPDRPWKAGYLDASQFREQLGFAPSEGFPIEKFIQAVQVDRESHHIQGLTGRSKPLVVHARHTVSGRRFTSARALWHFSFGGQNLALITDAHTSKQRRIRAFAAELLAPAAGIRHALDKSPDVPVTQTDIQRLADLFEVGPRVIEHQIWNQLGQRVDVN